jgi:hypothetical protein
MRRGLLALLLGVAAAWTCSVLPAAAQVTTGTVSGTVSDAQGGVIPGATVTLISESRGTRLTDVVTGSAGDFTIPNVPGDTYTVQVVLQGFKTTRRPNVTVSPGDRVVVPAIVLDVGGLDETVAVRAEAPLVPSQSGERSFTVTTDAVQNLPVSTSRNFAQLTELTPGVVGTERLGGGGQNNIMMDGVSTMDTGNNGQMLQMNVESIAEVKVLTSGYQAEYGRSSGMQITAVTKSGTNQFRGSLYDIERNSDWNSNSWRNRSAGDPKNEDKQRDWGYSIGGPVGKPGGLNKLFFFYSHEYRPRATSGSINRFRVPTALERRGDFSQSTDNNGNRINLIRDYRTGLPCTSADTRGCFQDGGVLGRIPQDRLYAPGLAVLNNLWPMPNADGLNYNLEIARPADANLIQQPAIRLDYQPTTSWRFTGKYSGQRERVRVEPGVIPGYNDVTRQPPSIHALSMTANWNINPTTFLEATYGWTQNELAGGGSGGILTTDVSNRLNAGLGDFPLLFPNAGVVNPDYYASQTLGSVGTPYFQDGTIYLPPNFNWGNRISNAPPNLQFPGWLNINRTQDFAVSLTKLMGRHTAKAGFYLNHSFKAQNLGAGGGGSFQGTVNFNNDSNNPLDTGFGYANAALGIFSQYAQQSQFVEGSYIYNNIEGYIQDNWKVTPRLTLDYGVRFTHQQPQYDELLQESNWFLSDWSAAAAPLLYQPGCPGGAYPCSSSARQAMNPATGELLGPNTAFAIGTLVPNSGDTLNGLQLAGVDIDKGNYEWPALVVAPRFGAAYDLTGSQSMILRGGFGIFYDRPTGNSIYAQVGNPPFSQYSTVRYSELGSLSGGLATVGPPSVTQFRYQADIPTSLQWNIGLQTTLPWSSTFDISYVGQHGYNMLENNGGGGASLNAVDYGAAYLPENQDPTRTASSVPGATALPTEILRPYRGYGAITEQWTNYYETSDSIQTSFQRRFRDGIAFGVNYTLGLRFNSNRNGPDIRLQHFPDGSYAVREDQQAYFDLNEQDNLRRHVMKANFLWDLPDLPSSSLGRQVLGYVLNDWQVSGIYTLASGSRYGIGYSYQSNGANVNLTGSPDYGARIRIVGDPGSGCSDNPYRQFNVEAFAGPLPGSVSMESGRNYMVGCPDKTMDMAIARNFRFAGSRNVQVRLDVFNVFDTVVYTARQTQLQLVSPTNQTVRNAQFLDDGSLNPSRRDWRSAGFGAATNAAALRTLQLQLRLQF